MSLSIVLDSRTKNKLGEHPLKLRIIHNRTSAHISLGFNVTKKDWDAKNERVRNSSKSVENVTRFNNLLLNKKAKFFNKVTELEEEGKLEMLNATQLKSNLLDEPIKIISVYDYLNQEYQWLQDVGKHGTARTYRDLINKLRKFTDKDLSFSDIDYNFLKALEKSHLEKGAKYSSLSIYLRTLRAAFNKAIKAGYVKAKFYPFNKYSIKNGEPSRRALNEESFRKFLNAEFEKGSANQIGKDYYLASFYLQGMNWIDMCFLQYKNFSSNMKRISYIRQKTGKTFNIQVSDKALKIINDFKPLDTSNPDDYVFPVLNLGMHKEHHLRRITNRRLKINSYLRSIADELEIPRFSIYSARHTYATLLWNNSRSATIAQQSLGHQTEKQTQEYLSYFGNAVVDEANEDLFSGF